MNKNLNWRFNRDTEKMMLEWDSKPAKDNHPHLVVCLVHGITCSSIDALAHSTPPPKVENIDVPYWEPRNLFGDEFIIMVTSSTPSLLISDQPSSANPLTASLNPLWFIFKNSLVNGEYRMIQEDGEKTTVSDPMFEVIIGPARGAG